MVPYSGYFSGGKSFLVFVVERRTTNFLPTKQYRIVPGCGLVYRDHANFSTNWPKFTAHENFTPRKIPAIRYVEVVPTLSLTLKGLACTPVPSNSTTRLSFLCPNTRTGERLTRSEMHYCKCYLMCLDSLYQ